MLRRIISLALVLIFLSGASLLDEQQQWLTSGGKPVVGGSVYIGVKDADPEVSPITIYSDRELTTPLANPQITDANGRTTNKIWVPGRYSIKLEDSNGVQLYEERDAGESEEAGITTLTNVQGTNTVTADGVPTITAYTDKEIYSFTVINANTGAVTLNIDSVGAKSLKRIDDGEALVSGELQTDQIVNAQYNSQHDIFEWLNPSRMTTGPPSTVTDGRVAKFSGTSGVKIDQGTKLEADLVTGPASAADNNVALFDGTTGKIIKQPTAGNNGQILQIVSGAAAWTSMTRFELFTANGTFNVPDDITEVLVVAVGGGGGGGRLDSGDGGGGGGGGGFVLAQVTVTGGGTEAVVVGTGGAGSASSGGNGTAGGNSAVSSTKVVANGGSGGGGGGSGGSGGGVSVTETRIIDSPGIDGGASTVGLTGAGGIPGGLINAGAGAPAAGAAGNNAASAGAGGSGGENGNGGNGKAGFVLFMW